MTDVVRDPDNTAVNQYISPKAYCHLVYSSEEEDTHKSRYLNEYIVEASVKGLTFYARLTAW